MNLEDLLDESGLQQDEWSLNRPRFGKDGQLEVIGWGGKYENNKFYILKCAKCGEDGELFGGGYFKILKSNLVRGVVPCGCARSPHWSKEQYHVLCSRKAKEIGYKFLDFVGEWRGAYTKIKMLCERHGEWQTGIIHHLVNKGSGCSCCASEANTKPDDVMIASFFASGAFHPDTKFWRSNRKTKHGVKSYWLLYCPECGKQGESKNNHLQAGKRPCDCSKQRQQEAYINWLIDDNRFFAIKFGIANNSKQRIKQQRTNSVYTMKNHSVYKFPDVASCKKAERECLQELECGIVLKGDMSDGWSETTWIYNLDKIIEIYERNGGVRQEIA